MAYAQGFQKMAQDLMDLPQHSTVVPSDMSPSDRMLKNYLQQIGATFLYLYHTNGNTNDICGQTARRLHNLMAILLIME
jgi:hypothetical protein